MGIGVWMRGWRVGGATERHGSNLRRGAFTAFVVGFLMPRVVAVIVIVMVVVVIMIVNVYGMTVVTIPVE